MLSGVGGSTVIEARERLSYTEHRAWAAYLDKHGSLHPGYRLELVLARIIILLRHALGMDADLGVLRPRMALQPLLPRQTMDR